jgi:hypothetical protein
MRKVQGVGKPSAPQISILPTQQYVFAFLVQPIAVEICPTGDTWKCIKTMAIGINPVVIRITTPW